MIYIRKMTYYTLNKIVYINKNKQTTINARRPKLGNEHQLFESTVKEKSVRSEVQRSKLFFL